MANIMQTEGKSQQATFHHDDYSNCGKFNLEEARRATAIEHSLTWWQALKTYRRATLWSVCEQTYPSYSPV